MKLVLKAAPYTSGLPSVFRKTYVKGSNNGLDFRKIQSDGRAFDAMASVNTGPPSRV